MNSTDLAEAYIRIAERHLDAAEAVHRIGMYEITVFHCYHAFESLACAAIALRSAAIPRRHQAKLETFIRMYRGFRFGYGAAALAAHLINLRDLTLYPEMTPTTTLPGDLFNKTNTGQLLKRTRGVVRSVRSALGI